MISTEALTATGAVGAALGALGDIGAEGGTSIGDFILIMIAFMFVDIFDTAGTLYSVGRAAGYVDENYELQNSDEAFMSDAAATIVGALVGTSTTTTYIEACVSGWQQRREDSNHILKKTKMYIYIYIYIQMLYYIK